MCESAHCFGDETYWHCQRLRHTGLHWNHDGATLRVWGWWG